jgi:CRP-like cAMP-binding protein
MNKQSITDYLSRHPFFSGMDDQYIEFLADSAVETQIGAGGILFRQGAPADKFYLLQSGQVSIQVPALVGPVLEIQQLGESQLLGWSWLIPPYTWNFQARVEEDSTFLEFDGRAVLARCEEDPRFGFELLKRFAALMSERLDAARQKMMDEWNPPGFA